MRGNDRMLGAVAFAAFAAASAVFGRMSPDFGHLRHPVALLGAIGEPNALAFNLLGFMVPGALLAWLAWRWRGQSDDATWRVRLGLQLLLLSSLAFAGQGLLPLDPTDLHAPSSRAHAVAWSVWWIAFAAGGVLVGVRFAGRSGIGLTLVVMFLAVAAATVVPPPLAQRIAVLAWFGWWLWAARLRNSVLSRA